MSDLGSLESLWKSLRNDLIHVAAFPVPDEKRRELLLRSARLDEQSEQQLKQWTAKLTSLDRQLADADQRSQVASLRRQISLTWLSRIESAVLQSELFATQSPDAAATGASAVRLAETGLVQLPAQSIVRDEVIRLLAEAQLQSGNPDAATVSLQTFLQSKPDNAPEPVSDDRVLSLMVRILIARGELDAAAERLDSYFGDEPIAAPKSAAMDLARLQFLISSIAKGRADATSTAIADWIEAIGQRSGPTVQARAETMAARASGLDKTNDPRLQIADGLYQLRTGQVIVAAVTLAKSAVADPNPERSIRTATQSAAILVSEQKSAAAAELLVQIASRHADQDDAANLALQAAGLLAEAESPIAEVEKTHAILQQILQTWPNQPASRVARDWLIDRAIAQSSWTVAAELAIDLPTEHWDETALQRCEILWQMAAGVPVSALGWNDFGDAYPTIECRNPIAWEPSSLSQQLDEKSFQAAQDEFLQTATSLQAILRKPQSNIPGSLRHRLQSILLDKLTNDLSMAEQGSEDADSVINAIASLRVDPSREMSETFDPGGRLDAMTWRLDRDAQLQPPLRPSVGKLLLRLHEGTGDSPIAKWRWHVWSDKPEATVQRWRSISISDADRGQIAAVLAQSLSQSESPPVQTLAWTMWRELADGLPRNSDAWSLASVRAIEAQYRSADREAATKSAQYLLLTSPPSDDQLLSKLQSIAHP